MSAGLYLQTQVGYRVTLSDHVQSLPFQVDHLVSGLSFMSIAESFRMLSSENSLHFRRKLNRVLQMKHKPVHKAPTHHWDKPHC